MRRALRNLETAKRTSGSRQEPQGWDRKERVFREGQLTGTHGGGCLGKELQGQKDSIQSSPATAHFIVTSASQTPPRFQLTSFQTLASPELPATLQPSLSTRGFGYFATSLCLSRLLGPQTPLDSHRAWLPGPSCWATLFFISSFLSPCGQSKSC